MNLSNLYRRGLVGLLLVLGAAAAKAQDSSLYRQPLPSAEDKGALTLGNTSFIYQASKTPRETRMNDIVTVIVKEQTQVTSKGNMQTTKNNKFDAQLKDWITLQNGSLKPLAMPDGDPRINGTLDSQFKANTQLQTNEGMTFRIAARVVDVRPNGTLVLEAHRAIRNNEESWEQSLTGIIRREDIMPGNTVLSENIAELSINKREGGHVRDGYRRGWVTKLYDYLMPF